MEEIKSPSYITYCIRVHNMFEAVGQRRQSADNARRRLRTNNKHG